MSLAAVLPAALALSLRALCLGDESAARARELNGRIAGAVERFELRVFGVNPRDPDVADGEPEEGDPSTAPIAPPPSIRHLPHFFVQEDSDAPMPPFSEKGKHLPSVEVMHRIARTAGWSMVLVGVGREFVDVDFDRVDPREALRSVLQASESMGVLRRDRLVVLPAPGSRSGGLIQRRPPREWRGLQKGKDFVRVLGDVTVPEGTVVHGDAVAVVGSVQVERGAVVEGNAVAVLGGVNVDQGAVVLGDGVAVLGGLEIERGGQVLGERVQVGPGRLFGGAHARRSLLSRLGPFGLGLFPTLALFAVVYLCGLVALSLWPERVRLVGATMLSRPLRSLIIGFLSWLLLLPLALLLLVSIVGIPLVPLLPLILFVAISLGLSAAALRIGQALPAGSRGERFIPPAALGMGMAVFLLVSFVPWIGASLLTLAQFFALGGAVGSRFGRSTAT